METFIVSQHAYDGNFLPSLNLLGGRYTLQVDMEDDGSKLYQVILTRWDKPYDEESEEMQSGDYVLLTNLGKRDNYKESLVSFLECAGFINDGNVEEIFSQNYKRKNDDADLNLLMDKAVSNGLMDIIEDGKGFTPTQKALQLIGLKTLKGLSGEAAMKKMVEILALPENKEYGRKSRAIRYTYVPLTGANGKTPYGICINGRPSPERITFDTEAEAQEYIKDKTTNCI